MAEICQVRPTRHKFLNYYTPDVIFDIRADITLHPYPLDEKYARGWG